MRSRNLCSTVAPGLSPCPWVWDSHPRWADEAHWREREGLRCSRSWRTEGFVLVEVSGGTFPQKEWWVRGLLDQPSPLWVLSLPGLHFLLYQPHSLFADDQKGEYVFLLFRARHSFSPPVFTAPLGGSRLLFFPSSVASVNRDKKTCFCNVV